MFLVIFLLHSSHLSIFPVSLLGLDARRKGGGGIWFLSNTYIHIFICLRCITTSGSEVDHISASQVPITH